MIFMKAIELLGGNLRLGNIKVVSNLHRMQRFLIGSTIHKNGRLLERGRIR